MAKKRKKEVWQGFRVYPCRNKALDGGDFCGTHDPQRKAERAAKRGPSRFERECAELARKAAEDEAMRSELERLRAENAALRERVESYEAVHPFHQWHDDDGPVLWYFLPVCEPAFHVGTPGDSDWPWDGDTPESEIGWARLPNPCRGIEQAKPAERGAGGA